MPYAQKGIIDQAREAMEGIQESSPEALHVARDQAAGNVLLGVADMLAQREYRGGVDGALVHHLGQGAFGNEEVTGRYMSLVAGIYNQAAKGGEDAHASDTPVLFIFAKDDPERASVSHTSVLVNIAAVGPVTFWSNRRRNDVEIYEGADDKLAVDTSNLLIMGETTAMDGDISKVDGAFGVPRRQGGYLLRQSIEVRDGSAEDKSGAKKTEDLLQDNPTILVGWEAIEEVLAARIVEAGSGSGLRQALQLREFFDAGGNLAALERGAPELRKVLKQAATLHNTIGRLARSS